MAREWSDDDPRTVREWSENGPRMLREWYENGTENDPRMESMFLESSKNWNFPFVSSKSKAEFYEIYKKYCDAGSKCQMLLSSGSSM